MNGDNVVASNNATYFDRFGDEHIPDEFKQCVKLNNDSRMFGFFFIWFIDLVLKGRSCSSISSLFFVLSIICTYYGNKNEKIFKEEKSTEILKILGLVNKHRTERKNMAEENIIQEFRSKEIDKTRNYFIEGIK